MEKIESTMNKLEMDYFEFVEKDIKRRKQRIKAMSKEEARAIVYNLLTNEFYKKTLSVDNILIIIGKYFDKKYSIKLKK